MSRVQSDSTLLSCSPHINEDNPTAFLNISAIVKQSGESMRVVVKREDTMCGRQSRVAQWYRVGLITQRSEDRNLSLLYFLHIICDVRLHARDGLLRQDLRQPRPRQNQLRRLQRNLHRLQTKQPPLQKHRPLRRTQTSHRPLLLGQEQGGSQRLDHGRVQRNTTAVEVSAGEKQYPPRKDGQEQLGRLLQQGQPRKIRRSHQEQTQKMMQKLLDQSQQVLEHNQKDADQSIHTYRQQKDIGGQGQGRMLRLKRMQCFPLKIITHMSSRELEAEGQADQVAGFIGKTYEILSNEEFSKIVYWASSGIEFVIKDVGKFQAQVLPRYFRHNKMNSFIRQLNMYGFHKSRTDHVKSVFSHPAFLRGRPDLLPTIKRKIKGRGEQQTEELSETPAKVERVERQEGKQEVKKKEKIEEKQERQETKGESRTAVKDLPATDRQLVTTRQFSFGQNQQPSFNMIDSKQGLPSKINLNHLQVSQVEFPNLFSFKEESECLSIEDKIEGQDKEREKRQRALDGNLSVKYMNPSCFFTSIRK